MATALGYRHDHTGTMLSNGPGVAEQHRPPRARTSRASEVRYASSSPAATLPRSPPLPNEISGVQPSARWAAGRLPRLLPHGTKLCPMASLRPIDASQLAATRQLGGWLAGVALDPGPQQGRRRTGSFTW